MARFHSILAAILVFSAASSSSAQTPSALQAAPATFTVFLSGAAIGSEQVTVAPSAEGWTIQATGRIGVPVSLSTARFVLRYDRDWRPLSLEIDATLRGQPLVLKTAFANGKAANSMIQAGRDTQKVDDVAPDAVVLPNLFFGAYEALALRLASFAPGSQINAYIAPEISITIKLDSVVSERIQTAARQISAKRYNLTFANPNSATAAEVWVDESGRLMRFRMPSQGLDVARDDMAAVSSRIERMARPTDEQARIQTNGFSLAATVSKPPKAATGPVARGPAVILVPGSGPVDRDETIAGVAIFAQLANEVADAGFVVVRFDKRGAGQSGGRAESATLVDFSDDVRAVVRYLEKRPDVDPKRIAIVGHSEGGFVTMLAASEEKKRIAAIALVATPGTSGAELVLEQQQHQLDGMALSADEKLQRIDLQKRIQAAVVTGSGWDAIPPAYKRQADTPWFRSFLTFDPARIMSRIVQPTLIVQGERDRQVSARHGQLLIGWAKARKNNAGADLAVIDGINHLLVPAVTGEIGEYGSLPDRTISPKLIDTLVGWLKDTLHVDTARAGR